MNSSAQSASDLDSFVTVAKHGGVPDDAIVPLLRQNGWSERRVYDALNAFYEGSLGLAPPRRNGRAEYARDGFAYLIVFFTLATWATALGNIVFYLIDRHVADPILGSRYAYASSGNFYHDLSWSIASIVIAFPIFFLMQRSIEVGLARRPETAESGVRTWLTYIALVITAMICIGDGIWFLQSFLSGELSTRFALHVATVATIGGGIFAYYLSGLRRGRPDDR